MATKLQLRRGTAAEWAAANPLLADGEVGIERDTGLGKIGDGATLWAALPYSVSRLPLPESRGGSGGTSLAANATIVAMTAAASALADRVTALEAGGGADAIYAEASTQAEEDAAFAAGARIVVRLDLLPAPPAPSGPLVPLNPNFESEGVLYDAPQTAELTWWRAQVATGGQDAYVDRVATGALGGAYACRISMHGNGNWGPPRPQGHLFLRWNRATIDGATTKTLSFDCAAESAPTIPFDVQLVAFDGADQYVGDITAALTVGVNTVDLDALQTQIGGNWSNVSYVLLQIGRQSISPDHDGAMLVDNFREGAV